jgi:hypothetical protein
VHNGERGHRLEIRTGVRDLSNSHGYDREGFLSEFFPGAGERAEVEVGAQVLINVSRAHRLAEVRKRVGLTRAEVAERRGQS